MCVIYLYLLVFISYICIINITAMIPQAILTQIANEMMISKGTTKTITGAADDSTFVLKIGCDNKGFFSFIFGAMTTPDGCFDLVQMIQRDMLLNNVH